MIDRDFIQKQVDFSTRQIAWCDREIEYLAQQLERTRKEDREMVEYVWSHGPLTRTEMEIWGKGKYEGTDTRKYKNQRRCEYRRRKNYQADLQRYQRMLEKF